MSDLVGTSSWHAWAPRAASQDLAAMRCSHEHVHLLVAIELANPGVQTNQWSGKNPFSDWPEPGEGLCLGAHSGRYNKYDCVRFSSFMPLHYGSYSRSETTPRTRAHTSASVQTPSSVSTMCCCASLLLRGDEIAHHVNPVAFQATADLPPLSGPLSTVHGTRWTTDARGLIRHSNKEASTRSVWP